MADDIRKLIVKNLPPELNEDDKKDLLKLFGANDVICFSQKGKLRNAAFTSFSDAEACALALKRLHQMDILGCRLKVEYATGASEQLANTHESRKTLNKQSNVGVGKNLKDSNNRLKDEEKDENEDLSDSISPKLGVHHSFPKHLSYLYPAPTVTTLTNIANALATIPKLYIQVLHLMNKMNLPPPFTGPTLTPPLPDDTIQLVDVCVDTTDLEDFQSSEESEIETDPEDNYDDKRTKDTTNQLLDTGRKRKRMKPTNLIAPNRNKRNKQQQQQDVEDAFENTQQVRLKRIEFKLAKNIASSLSHAASPSNQNTTATTIETNQMTVNEHSDNSQGFGVLQPTKEDLSSDDDDINESEKDFISSKEIMSRKMPEDEIDALPQMKNYQKGAPTNRLYIKNLAKQTSREDLEFIFKRFIRKCSESEKESFDIRLMKEGRMKGQAFVTFPSNSQASKALEKLHGFILHEKPMIISNMDGRAEEKDGKSSKGHWKFTPSRD